MRTSTPSPTRSRHSRPDFRNERSSACRIFRPRSAARPAARMGDAFRRLGRPRNAPCPPSSRSRGRSTRARLQCTGLAVHHCRRRPCARGRVCRRAFTDRSRRLVARWAHRARLGAGASGTHRAAGTRRHDAAVRRRRRLGRRDVARNIEAFRRRARCRVESDRPSFSDVANARRRAWPACHPQRACGAPR